MTFVLVFVIKLFSISFYYTINSQKSQDKTAPRADKLESRVWNLEFSLLKTSALFNKSVEQFMGRD